MKTTALHAVKIETSWIIFGFLAIFTLVFGFGGTLVAQTAPAKNVVLVHGGFVDGSGWEGVYKMLKKDGYTVAVVQNPTLSLADDVAVTKRAIANQNGPVILVGHSYGGAVITEAGNDPKVVGLVYIAAFAPDKGESVSDLIKNPPPGVPVPPILPPQDGFLFLDKAKFAASFAADVKPDLAAFMADSQVPWGAEALNGTISEAAWKTKPSWYLVSTEDKMIPSDAQRTMSKCAGSTVVEAKGSHAIYVSQPKPVVAVIEKAAKGVPPK
jgi:pimeloyl-ACP methyl ester carboxylesterase